MPMLATPTGTQPNPLPDALPAAPAGEDAPRADATPHASAAAASAPSARLTAHARRRSTRRGLSQADIEYVRTHGRPIQRTGATFYFLARRDVPRRDLRWAARLVGAIVVVARTGEIITVYRNRAGLPTIRRKLKYRTVPEPPARDL